MGRRFVAALAVAGTVVAGCASTPSSTVGTLGLPSAPITSSTSADSLRHPVLIPVPGPAWGAVTDVQIVQPLPAPSYPGAVLAHRYDDGHLDVATLVAGTVPPFEMTDDGTLTTMFGSPARRYVPDNGPTTDRLCLLSAVVLPERHLTVWANDPVSLLRAVGDTVHVDGRSIVIGKLPAGDEVIEPVAKSVDAFMVTFAVGTDLRVSMSTVSATVPAGCGPWTSVRIGDRTAWASPQGPSQPIGAAPASVSWQTAEWSSVTVTGTGSLRHVIALARSLSFVSVGEFNARHHVDIATS